MTVHSRRCRAPFAAASVFAPVFLPSAARGGLAGVAVALLVAFAAPARAERVIELFTSHGCSSCPSADRLLGELIEADPGLVALEYHVDYWNSLVHGGDGNFVDPFSDAAWSLRQRAYDGVALGGRQGIYTPQAILDGAYAAVGSDRARIGAVLAAEASGGGKRAVDARVGAAPAERAPAEGASNEGPSLSVVREGGALLVEVAGVRSGERRSRTPGHLAPPAPDTGEVALVRFLRRAVTPITGGENRGLELVNHHVVTAIEPLGRVSGDGSLSVRAAAPREASEGCAVLVRHGAAPEAGSPTADAPSSDRPRTHLAGMLCPDPA